MIWGRLAEEMVDRPFFDEVAPCCRNTPVQFAFLKFLERGFVEVIYEHEVPYKGHLIDVKIHVKAVSGGEYCWIFSKLMSVSELPDTITDEPSGEAA